MEPESANTFTRTLWGYNARAVDAHVEMLATKQQLLLDDVESHRPGEQVVLTVVRGGREVQVPLVLEAGE